MARLVSRFCSITTIAFGEAPARIQRLQLEQQHRLFSCESAASYSSLRHSAIGIGIELSVASTTHQRKRIPPNSVLRGKNQHQYHQRSCDRRFSTTIDFTHALPLNELGTCHKSLSSFLAAIEPNQNQKKKKKNEEASSSTQPLPTTITAPNNKLVELSTLIILTNKQRREILLGKKLRGFGTGKYNGFGGRLEESKEIDPTPAHGAMRELAEEANLSLPLGAFTPVGTLSFTFEDRVGEKMVVHLFHVDVSFEEDVVTTSITDDYGLLQGGDDTTTVSEHGNSIAMTTRGVSIIDPNSIEGCDEIIPRWFSWSEIPLHQMFADDSVWLTYFLSQSAVRDGDRSNTATPIKMNGWFHFAPGGDDGNKIEHYFLDT